MIDSDRSIDDFVMALNHIHELPYIEQHRKKLQMEVDALTRQISVLSKNLEYLSKRATTATKPNSICYNTQPNHRKVTS